MARAGRIVIPINAKTFRFSFLAGLLAFCLDMILSGQARKEHGLDNEKKSN